MEIENQILREITVAYSYAVKPSQLPQVASSHDAFEYFMQSWDKGKIAYVEHFKLMLLNRRNRLLGIAEISKGGCSGTLVDAKVVFACALKCNAATLILAHNHPSGEMSPSEADLRLTRQLHYLGSVLTLPVVDHLIITTEGYYSFADAGML